MMERGGAWTWFEDQVYAGIRQDVTETADRYRILRNVHLATRGALTKDKGIIPLTATATHTYTNDVYGGLDARWYDGTQKLIVAADDGANGKFSIYDPATNGWTTQAPAGVRTKPWMGMFANKLLTFDGTTPRSMTQGGVWATPASSAHADIQTSSFAVVYANRLLAFANTANPFYFYPSGVRDETDWDASLAVQVTGSRGERILGAGRCGRYLLVGGEEFLRGYYLGTASPRDWDWEHISEHSGPINWQSFVDVTRPRGGGTQSFTFFWTKEGPAMCMALGEGLPRMVPLWDPIRRMCQGTTYQGLVGLELSMYDQVEGVWVPEFNEVRFTCSSSGKTKHDMLLCLDVDSAIRYAMSPDALIEGELVSRNYPFWRIRDNEGLSSFPVSTVFQCEVSPATNEPSTSGLRKAMCAQDGVVYIMDMRAICKDLHQGASTPTDQPIKMMAHKDGYNGYVEGVREHVKSLREVHIRTTQEGNYDLNVVVVADGGKDRSSNTVNLSSGISLWGAGNDWGDGSMWNAGEFVTEEIGLHALGTSFDLQIYDDGAVEAPVEINSWSLSGYLEDRR